VPSSEKSHLTRIRSIDALEIYNLAPNPVWVFDIDNYGFWWGNRGALEFWQLDTLEQLIAKDLSGDDEGARNRMWRSYNYAIEHGVCKDPWTAYPDGKAKTMIIMHKAVLIGEEQHRGIIGFVNEEVNLGEEPENLLLAEAMRYTHVAITCYTLDGEIILENPAATKLYSKIKDSSVTDATLPFVARFFDQSEGETCFASARNLQETRAEFLMHTRSGLCRRSLDIRMTKHPLSGESVILVSDYDISELHDAIEELESAKEELRLLANYDALTGLPSLHLFRENLELTLSTTARSKCKLAIHFIDLDGFKAINDTHGHDVGDAVLKEVGKRLSFLLRQSDRAARIGGDEFVLMQTNLFDTEHTAKVAQKIIDSLSAPIAVDNVIVTIGASIGIAIYPEHGTSLEALLKSADQSMYEVKRTGKNNFHVSSTKQV